MKKAFYFLLVLIVCACNVDNYESPYEGDGTQIEIYLIKEEAIEVFDPFEEVNVNDLEETPWLSHDEIEFYDWSSHSFYLQNGKEQNRDSRGKYFVLTADKQPVFTGSFHSMLMSSIPPFPSIMIDYSFFPNDVIDLNTFGFTRSDSILSQSPRFRIEMENSGLLKEGIDVDLLELKRTNSSTIKYTYKVTNIDNDPIYVLDSDKMGTSRFHAYTNGIHLQKDDKYYNASDFDTTLSDKIEQSWYYKLSPGKSFTRSLQINGYNMLPTGKVKASFHFPGAYQIKAGEWRKSNGRIWLGNYRTEKEITLK